jgi:type VI secretion system protein ImpG
MLPYFEPDLDLLSPASDSSGDPQAAHLIHSIALQNASNAGAAGAFATGSRFDAGATPAAHSGVLAPHEPKPIPSCSIVRFDNSAAPGAATTTPRGSMLKSLGGTAVACRFRTAYDVTVAPIQISTARFESFINAPSSLRLPADITASLKIGIACTAANRSLAELRFSVLRVFIDGDAPLRAALRDTLFMRANCACIETEGQWRTLDRMPVHPAGFHDADALLPISSAGQPAHRLLTEYFAFPEKFAFFDIDLQELLRHAAPGCASVTLHLALNGLCADSSTCRLLRTLTRDNLLLSCTPIVNLFRHIATPIQIRRAQSSYPLMPDALPARASEIYSVDSLHVLQRSGRNQSVATEFLPYHALHDCASSNSKRRYYIARRDETLAAGICTHEYSLLLIDRDTDPLDAQGAVASIGITCTNRNLPQDLPGGLPGGDFDTETAAIGLPIRLLRKPIRTQRHPVARGAKTGRLPHQYLDHRALTQEGLPAFTAMLRQHALPGNAIAQRQIDGLTGLSHRQGTAALLSPSRQYGANLIAT